MRAPVSIALALALVAGAATADPKAGRDPKDPKPQKVDPNPKKVDVTVLRDNAGGTYVVVGLTGDSADRKAFYGTGKTLYEQRFARMSRNGDAWSLAVWTPRLTDFHDGYIEKKKDGSFFKSCWGEDDAVLSEVTGDKAVEVMTKSTFMSPLHVRQGHLLARDDQGIYYFVDTLRGSERAGVRLFVGRKGALKQLPIIDSATDDAGQLFITRTGSLKAEYEWHPDRTVPQMEHKRAKMFWIKGERRKPLDWIDFAGIANGSVIVYKDLGLYGALGTICDNV